MYMSTYTDGQILVCVIYRPTYRSFEHHENVLVVVRVYCFARVTQIQVTICASKPFAFNALHTTIADCCCVDKGSEIG